MITVHWYNFAGGRWTQRSLTCASWGDAIFYARSVSRIYGSAVEFVA